MERRDIISCIRSCEDRATAIKNGETKYAWGKGQKKRAYDLEMMKIKVLKDLYDGELEKVVHGKWVSLSKNGSDKRVVCSNCLSIETKPLEKHKRCPVCVAKMDLEDE